MADPASLTTWTPAAKLAGVGIGIVAVIGIAVAVRGIGRCGRLERYYRYAARMGGPKDNEAVSLRIEASGRGCEWAQQIEASEEQDRYWAAKRPSGG